MKIASHIRTRCTRVEHQGFTLIELLVVISIIAVLAGLLFPAMGAVRTMARKTSAKNDVTQIVNGVKAFYSEYGRYPLPGVSTPSGNKVYRTDNGSLIEVLRYASATADALNPRKIRFLEVPTAKDGRSGLEVASGGNNPASTANWLDPWRNPYEVFISTVYQPLGNVSVTAFRTAGQGTVSHNLNFEVAAASGGNPEGGTLDPVVSW